jgi:uncharacterized protein YbaP (TraB family)
VRRPFPSPWLSCVLLLCWSGCARPPEPAQRDAARAHHAARAPEVPAGLFLYAVERGGHVSHLLGTIHLGFGFEEVLTPDARERFTRSSQVITETDLGADSAARLMRAALLPPDQSLAGMLGPETWRKLQARVGGQIPEAVLSQLRPWLPAVLLGIDDLKRALAQLRPGKGAHMMDVELMQVARRAGKLVRHLESVDQQIAVFDAISTEEQLTELSHALSSDSAAQSRSLIEAYASGDEGALARALFDGEQVARAPGFYQAVLFERNEHWLPVLESAVAQGDVFVAVGAAHLLGERGLLAELRQRGYSITRVH